MSCRECTCGTPAAAQTKINIYLPFAKEWSIILPLNVLLIQTLFNLWYNYLFSINVLDVSYQLHLCWEVSVLCLDHLP